MKKSITLIAGLGMILFLAGSCKKDNNNQGSTQKTQTQIINEWIYNTMTSVYFWKNAIPSGLDPMKATDPKAFFYSMLYTQKDHWSYITDNAQALESELQGEPTSMGISPGFARIGNTSNVAIFIEYVYPNSPASDAGLKRGDFILSIDGQRLNTDNYYDLYSKKSYTAGLGDYSTGSLQPNGEKVDLTAEAINADPVLYHDVIDVNGEKTGYLVFTEFTPGTNNKYMTELGSVFDDFKSQGINNLIVDLRYNPGGSLNVAQFLASGIAPSSVDKDTSVLVRFQYNQEVQDYIVSSQGEEALVERFSDNGHNLNMQKVIFITGRGTASASELVITGLEPYMTVQTVGDTTVGKYTAMWVITDTQNPPRHNWAMMPVVLKYANANGVTDFENGLAPDYYLADDIHDAKPFGDLSEPLLAKALEVATGQPVPQAGKKAAEATPLHPLKPRQEMVKENLIVPHDPQLPLRIREKRQASELPE